MSEFNAQRQAILAHQYKAMEMTNSNGDHLDNKAATLLQSGAFIIALVGAVKIPSYVYAPNTAATIGIIIAFAAFAGMILLALRAWFPSDVKLPGTIDWAFLWNEYVYAAGEEFFNQMLSDVQDVITESIARNAIKARCVTYATWLFIVQIVGILILALTA